MNLERKMNECFCGCGDLGVHRHHVVYRQHLRGRSIDDERNLVTTAFRCHERHHKRIKPYDLSLLPDSVYEYAREVLGAGPAFNYLRRFYGGEDPRLDAMLIESEAA